MAKNKLSGIIKNYGDDAYLTNKEAADFLRIGKATLNSWIYTGKYDIPYITVGKRIRRFKLKDLKEFANSYEKLKR